MSSDEQQWIVAPDEARIRIAIGREAKLSPELREALQNLIGVLEKREDVQGYMICNEVKIESCANFMECKGVTL